MKTFTLNLIVEPAETFAGNANGIVSSLLPVAYEQVGLAATFVTPVQVGDT